MSENNGLVFSYILDGKGGGKRVDWEKLREWSPEQGTLSFCRGKLCWNYGLKSPNWSRIWL